MTCGPIKLTRMQDFFSYYIRQQMILADVSTKQAHKSDHSFFLLIIYIYSSWQLLMQFIAVVVLVGQGQFRIFLWVPNYF